MLVVACRCGGAALPSCTIDARVCLTNQNHSKDFNACFAKVDVDAADDVASFFSVRSMPTFVFLGAEDGRELLRFSGCDKSKLLQMVARTCARVGDEGKKED